MKKKLIQKRYSIIKRRYLVKFCKERIRQADADLISNPLSISAANWRLACLRILRLNSAKE